MDGDARRPTTANGPPDDENVGDTLPQARRPSVRPPLPRADSDRQADERRYHALPDDEDGEDEADEDEDDEKPPIPRWKKLLLRALFAVLAAAVLIGGLLYWLDARQYASTDDAFIDAYISQVSSRVAGRVTQVAIQDNQHVKAGQLLVELDPRDFQVKLDQAEAQRAQAAAQFEQARAALGQLQAAVDQAEANVRVSEADFAQARSDAARYRGIDAKAVTRQAVDNANNALKSGQARVDANQQAVAAAQANVKAQQAQIGAAQANLKAANVAVENAELQLSYTHITAPRDGQVAKRTVNLGDYVNPGQALLAVVGEDRWVTANFKETQLAGMRIGQEVDISVDACPDHGITGRIDSFQPGSGSAFSALPAENATGNYVKVVQRIPVKITLEHQDAIRCRLSPGMSAVPSVKVN